MCEYILEDANGVEHYFSREELNTSTVLLPDGTEQSVLEYVHEGTDDTVLSIRILRTDGSKLLLSLPYHVETQ